MIRVILFLVSVFIITFSHAYQANNPHQNNEDKDNTLYTVFKERPKHLDPAKAYSASEYAIIAQIYEPPFQYNYLKRPYVLEPLTAASMPKVEYKDKAGKILPNNVPSEEIATSSYIITIKPNIYYAPHPGFVKAGGGDTLLYQDLPSSSMEDIYSVHDFNKTDTRELNAGDYVYEIKRLANPKLHSPIAGIMGGLIVGFAQFQKEVLSWSKLHPHQNIDLREFNLKGVQQLNKYTYQITIKGKYPQFLYWLAMPFFSPMPWEIEQFYMQNDLIEKNITLDWYPVGTGAYYLAENNPNRQMVLQRNPNFHSEYYPSEGELNDEEEGYLDNAGLRLPFIDTVLFVLEKESIPMWNKFLQGYYDRSGISSDSFDQAVKFSESGKVYPAPEIAARDISLKTTVQPSVFYWGFNMLDPVVGGYGVKSKKLRQALSIVFNVEEYISIFMNGRGVPAYGPIPNGIYGNDGSLNTLIYDPITKTKKSLTEAKLLLSDAGYPNGVNEKTGKPLILNLDVTSSSGPDDKARLSWLRAQFKRLGIQLNIRATQYNRFREKIRTGQAQIYSLGWNADYPDPENFLMLLYGPNSKVKYGGENASNYQNKEFDKMYDEMSQSENSIERKALIQKMVEIVREDAPWIWGFYPKSFSLAHAWNSPIKPNAMANNTIKYARIDPKLRKEQRSEWNQPNYQPIWFVMIVLVVFSIPVVVSYWRKERIPPKKIPSAKK